MNSRGEFKPAIRGLQFLLGFQRGLRMLVRAAWLGLSGYLLGWAGSTRVAWLEDSQRWVMMGAALAVLPLLGILITWPRQKKLVWSVDRKLGYLEQVSTAWSVMKARRTDPLALGLLEDAAVLVRQTVKRLLLRGWFLERDLLSLGVAGVLALMISLQMSDTQVLPELATGARPARLPGLLQDPTIEQVFPDGVMGMISSAGPIPGAVDAAAAQDAPKQLTDAEKALLASAMAEMGGMLGDDMSTYELSESLKAGDLLSSAAELEKLSDQLEKLSQETKDKLSEAMIKTAGKFGAGDLEELQDSLQQAGSSLESPDRSSALETKEEVDNVASEMRSLAEALSQDAGIAQTDSGQAGEGGSSDADESGRGGGAGSGTTSSQVANPRDFERLGGQGETVVIELPEESFSGVLIPGQSSERSPNTIQGAYGRRAGFDSRVGGMPIIPQYYPWYSRNVVETYFQFRR